MLKEKTTGSSGQLPPDMTDQGPELTTLAVGFAANQPRFERETSHARRMRRSERAMRGLARRHGGWTVGLW